ncbi:MAG: glycosyltransferase family 4 protein [Raineya sp.]|nr:glycosyltransferase family 4 protein [Raineya sp.]
MKIIYLHQYFRKSTENGSHRSWYISQALQKKGFCVEIITAGHTAKIQMLESLKIHYVKVDYKQSMNFVRRIIAFLVFLLKATKKIFHIKEISYIYATSTPLTVGIVALILKKIRKIPYVFEVRDLWPLVPIEMGFVKNRFLQKLLFWLEKKIYQNAEKIIVLSPPMQAYVHKIVPEKPILCVPNMSDCQTFFPQNKKAENEPFRIAYFGSIGKANALERLLAVAQKCPQIEFWIIGNGSEKRRLMKIAPSNVQFFDEKPKNQLNELLAYVDAFYVSFAEFEALETCSPNKFFDGIAAGKMCITNTKGWIKNLVEQNLCGFYAGTPQEFEQKIQPFLQDKSLLQKYSENARQLAENEFEKNKLCQKIVDFIF